jgi:hypothetical protein
MSEKDDILADGIITRQIQLLRFTANTRGQVLEILRRMEEELTEKLFYSGRKLTDIGRDDLARLLRQTTDLIEQYYSEAAGYMGNELTALGRVEAVAVAASLDGAFRGAVTPSLPTEAYFRRLAGNTLIQGAPSAAWWKQQSQATSFRFANEVRQGLAQAETNAQIVQRIMGRATGYSMIEGKRVYRYAGGAMDVERRNAAALVQTSVQAVANTARRDTFLANDDIIKGVRHVSTLDSHTSHVCVGYSQAAWSIPGYKPLAPNTKLYNGGTPRHWNCRSVEIPITKTFRELGLDLPEFNSANTTRSANGGPVAADLSFGAYLKRKPDSFVDDLLGPGRAQLWRDGKMTLPQLLDQSGRPLTLKELRKKYGG